MSKLKFTKWIFEIENCTEMSGKIFILVLCLSRTHSNPYIAIPKYVRTKVIIAGLSNAIAFKVKKYQICVQC